MTAADRFKRNMGSALAMATGGNAPTARQEVAVSSIRPGEAQPRTYFDEAALERLAADIRQHGILQPLLVRPAGAGYELVDGERRWRAAQMAGLSTVPVYVRTLTLEQARMAAVSTAQHKEKLTPIEITTAKLGLAALTLGLSDLEEAKLELGRLSRPTADPARREQVDAVFGTLDGENLSSFVKNSLPLLSYPSELQQAMRDGLDKSKAKTIKNAPEALQSELLDMALGGASRAELVEVVKAAQPAGSRSAIETAGRNLSSRKWRDRLTPEQAEALAQALAGPLKFLTD